MGYTTQPTLKLITDVGRVTLSLYANGAATGASAAEQAITASISSGTSAVTTSVSYTIPSGKTLRILNISFSVTGSAVATLSSTVFNLRLNTLGSVTTASTPILLASTIGTAATALAFVQTPINLPQGLDVVGDGTASIGLTVNSTFVVNAPTISFNLTGFLFST